MGRKGSSSARTTLPLPAVFPPGGMTEPQWQACLAILTNVYRARDGSRNLADIFRDIPDRTSYPDYFEAIPEPECLDNVARNLGAARYDSPAHFFKQLHLVFLNAKHYNEEGSRVWTDAKQLEDQLLKEWTASAAILTPTSLKLAQPKSPQNSNGPALAASSSQPPPVPSSDQAPTYPPSSSTLALTLPLINDPSSISKKPTHAPSNPVVEALDARLPRWPGPVSVILGSDSVAGVPGSGWWGEGAPDYERQAGGSSGWGARIKSAIHALAGYRSSGRRLAEVFDGIPSSVAIPYLSFSAPLSFGSIQINVSANRYRSLRDFDMDMCRLFEKARRYYVEGSEDYGNVLVLQRLYNAMTAPYPMALPTSGVPDSSPTLFASLPAGPGNARSQHETSQELRAGALEEDVGFGITTFRVGTKDRTFTEEARQKGMSYRTGDFVHLINPDDAAKPIVGQVFKTFVPTKGYRTHHVTVCWYYRPEQTVHTADREFFDREVFKTSHFCDHPVEDIIERVSVQFYVKWIRGRSQEPEFYPGWPSYICHSRYNDRLWLTVRIKNWGSCIPDELRQTDFMAVVPYERPIDPVIVKSPFLRDIKGPGFFSDPRGKLTAEDEDEDEGRRPKATKMLPMTLGPVTSPIILQPVSPATAPANTPPVNHSAIQGWSRSSGANIENRDLLPRETTHYVERDVRGNALWFSGQPLAPGMIAEPKQTIHSVEYLEYVTKRKRGLEPIAGRNYDRGVRLKLEGAGSPWCLQGDKAEEISKSWKAV